MDNWTTVLYVYLISASLNLWLYPCFREDFETPAKKIGLSIKAVRRGCLLASLIPIINTILVLLLPWVLFAYRAEKKLKDGD